MAQDTTLQVTQAFPATNASTVSPTLDLKILSGNPSDWRVGYILAAVPALSNHTSTTLTIQLQTAPPATGSFPPSAGSFANTAPGIIATLTGVGGAGTPATNYKFPLPPGTYGFIRFAISVGSGDGTLTGSSTTFTWESGARE